MKTTKKPSKHGPSALRGSARARRCALVLLEVLSGATGPQAGSESLGISLNRYYQLETRGVQGLIDALEPRPRGKQRSVEKQLADATQQRQSLERQLGRYQSLLRAAQRSLGVKTTRRQSRIKGKTADGTVTKTTRRTRRTTTVRAKKIVAALAAPVVATDDAPHTDEVSP